ncbi:Solute carrier family 22 member 15 [Papilio xuthus]|uniref:Solute carrier family 22 member 15 n=1 Tax=Papilio xuthus TaxID=66420 RepID=A0A194PKF1_PAPXU|nr:Solute carrier family 22 member 15 [Papilio xuthus]
MDSVFDQALIEIGQDGRFQKKFDIIYNVIFAVLWPMAYMNLILALVVVPHMCQVSGKPDSISELYWKEINIPQYTNAAGEVKFESCLMYINGSSSNDTKACDKYEYDKTWYEETVPTKNNWVCDKELYVANIFAASKIGELVGSMVFGWFGDAVCISVNYTVIMMSSGDKSDGNPFLEFLWQALAEVPGYFIAAWLADRIGRRNTGVLSFAIGACMWIILALRESSSNAIFRHPLMGSAIVIVTRLSATMGYYIINILNFELYPTCIRQSGMCLGNLFSSGGSALAPYIFYLGHRVNSQLSSVILTGVSVIGVISTSLLPETLNKKLPETIEDAQVFGKTTQTYTPVLLNTSDEDPVVALEKNEND